jgi:hypothetical protein
LVLLHRVTVHHFLLCDAAVSVHRDGHRVRE